MSKTDDEIAELERQITEKDETIRKLRKKLKAGDVEAAPSGKKALARSFARIREKRNELVSLLHSGKLSAFQREEYADMVRECDKALARDTTGRRERIQASNTRSIPPKHMLAAAGLTQPTAMVSERADGVLRLNTTMTPEQARERHAQLQRELGQ